MTDPNPTEQDMGRQSVLCGLPRSMRQVLFTYLRPGRDTGGRGMTKFPEHNKLRSLGERRDTVQEFIDWLLDEQGNTICHWQESRSTVTDEMEVDVFGRRELINGKWVDPMKPVVIYDPEGFYPIHTRREQMMADFFGIDLGKIEAEKRAMLDEIRAANYARESA